MKAPVDPLLSYLETLEDPRRDGPSLHHPLSEVLFIALCAMICGADTFIGMARWGQAQEDWLRTLLVLPNGIPSHDTFGRVFAALDATAFAEMFVRWMADVFERTDGEVVAIDGKTLRRSFARADQKAAIHLVNAWASQSGVSLGQVRTDADSNEITAVPRLLALLELSGCLVTLDAMGCQREIAAQIVEKGADYVLPVKGNQPHLQAEVEAALSEAIASNFSGSDVHDTVSSEETGHGRQEKRELWCMQRPATVDPEGRWVGLCAIARIRRTRTIGGQTSVEESDYITSLPGKDARVLLNAIRAHWSVENQLHWRLDVQFGEDDVRIRAGNAAENVGRLRQMSLNLLKQEKTAKVGIANKRLMAGWNNDYLRKVIGF